MYLMIAFCARVPTTGNLSLAGIKNDQETHIRLKCIVILLI